MGRQHKLISDPSAAHSHVAGATVTIIQQLEHAQLGTIAYAWPRLRSYHQVIASEAFEEFRGLHNRIVTFEVRSGMRTIGDHEFLGQLYRRGCEFVLNAMLAVQHLCNEIEASTETATSTAPILERLASATTRAGIDLVKSGRGYAGLLEIRRVREAIEHPTPDNTYRGRSGEWDQVPLAWMLSDRAIEGFERWGDWFGQLCERWTGALTARGPVIQTFEGVTRGVTSTRQSKKPPPTSS